MKGQQIFFPMKYKLITLFLFIVLLAIWLFDKPIFKSSDNNTFSVLECGQELEFSDVQQSSQLLSNLEHWFISNQLNSDFELQQIAKGTCVLSKEQPAAGYYIKKSQGAAIFLQAPHAHDDLLSGDLVKAAIASKAAPIFAYISSVSRELLDPSNEAMVINDLSLSLIQQQQIQAIVQLHGFSQQKRLSTLGQLANVIVSAGTFEGNYHSRQVYECLNKRFEHTYYYGDDIFELGATKNWLNKQLLNNDYDNHFVHVEISYSLRKKLLSSPLLFNNFMSCIIFGATNV